MTEWKVEPSATETRLNYIVFHALKWVEVDRWLQRSFGDGTEQWTLAEVSTPRVFIERVVGVKSRRKRWCIVSRRPPERWRQAKYPPKLSGPFPTLDAAKAAYRILHAAGQLT